MSSIGGIPPILDEMLSSEDGFVSVVLGPPGTGKSLFIQEIFREYGDSLLIITRSENHSILEKLLSKEIKNWSNRHIFSSPNYQLDISLPCKVNFSDCISSLLGKEIEIDHKLVLIDSWTDFLHPVEEPNRYIIQQGLITAAREENRKLVLIAEGEWNDKKYRSLFHSCDGVIQLEKIRDSQRMYRQIVIEKMRSTPLNQDSYLFTLHKGRFTYIPWYKHQYPAITVEREPIPDPSPEHMSTGNSSLDQLLYGGFQKGRLSLVEVDDLSVPYLETIYVPFLSNHLQQNRPAVILLPEGWSPETFTKSLSQFVDESQVKDQVVFFGRQALSSHENARALDEDPKKTLQEIRYEASVLERKFNREVTELFALDTLENMYGASEVRGLMAEISSSLPTIKRTTIAILGRDQEINSESISHHVHLRVQEICGVLSVCGVNPRTSYLAVRPILSGGFLDYDLMPIV